MSHFILFFLLFPLSLLVLPFGASMFETPKVILAEGLIVTLLFTYLFKKGVSWKDFNKSQVFVVLLLFLMSLLSLIFLREDISFFGNPFRMQGIFLLWHLMVFSLLSSKINLPNLAPSVLYTLFISHAVASVAIATSITGRLVGTLGEPNALASFLVFLWPFIYFKGNRLARVFGSFLTLFLIVLTDSRSGLIAFVMQGIFLLLIFLINLPVKKSLILSLGILALSLYLPFIEYGGLYENRAEIWQTAWYSGVMSPVIGHGFGSVEYSLKEASAVLNNNVKYQYVDSSHNFLLDLWVQGGLIALVGMLYLVLVAFKNMVKTGNLLGIVIMLDLLSVMLFNPVSVVTLLAFWWLIGASFTKNQASNV